jgi:signal transduction histidine kinase
VYEIEEDRNGGLYFTSSHTIYYLKKDSDSFCLLNLNKNIEQNYRTTLTDNSGNLWIVTYRSGLLKVNTADNSVTNFNNRKGLLSNTITDEWKSKNGTIFLPTQDGFQYFQPDSVKRDTTHAPLHITSISILENPLKADYDKFSDSTLRISYKQNMISFDFGLMDYSFSENIIYQYKLEGFNDKWINAGKRPTATYTNLDAGNYTFRVRAKNHDGVEMNQEAIVHLKITPPFWKTWWFLSALIIVVLGVLFIWIRSLQLKIKSQKILNRFATSLYGQNTIEEIFWDIARECVKLLGFVDCVIYVKDEKRNVLLQKAAYGPKNTGPYEIMNPIEIPFGTGIVGMVAKTAKAERIGNTMNDPRYIMDDERRLSELTVPVIVDGNVFGVIDSEHPKKNFYSRWHLRMLKEIAAICSAKISLQVVQDRIRSKIARDLHDDMGSTLSSINIISKMALENANGIEQVNSHLKKIQENSGNMMESMSDIVWAITPSNDTLEKVIYRMKEFAADILEPLNIRYDFVENGDFRNIKLDLNKRKDFYLLFKEAINNAAKYSHCNQISIGLSGSESMIEMKIHDNGDGFDVLKARNGNGLANMNDRARQMLGHLDIESVPGRGTTVCLKIKSHD